MASRYIESAGLNFITHMPVSLLGIEKKNPTTSEIHFVRKMNIKKK